MYDDVWGGDVTGLVKRVWVEGADEYSPGVVVGVVVYGKLDEEDASDVCPAGYVYTGVCGGGIMGIIPVGEYATSGFCGCMLGSDARRPGWLAYEYGAADC